MSNWKKLYRRLKASAAAAKDPATAAKLTALAEQARQHLPKVAA